MTLCSLETEPEEQSHPYGLEPAPIQSEWILAGNPLARGRIFSGSTDDRAFTAMWECTEGCFNWFYDIDETIMVLEGNVILEGSSGRRHELTPGDTFFFPTGSRFRWTVPVYVRKLAFIHVPLSPTLRRAQGTYRALKRLIPQKTTPKIRTALGGVAQDGSPAEGVTDSLRRR